MAFGLLVLPSLCLCDISLFTVVAEMIAMAVPKVRAELVTLLDSKMNSLWVLFLYLMGLYSDSLHCCVLTSVMLS